ncbi:radical SAM protein [Magnetovibrio sp. PR-2]|uniref:radical SAM/SPASM domain-containing protein n=1 Tax=Magnetovibrio sp. PR-2 TaxID=3120356 RepID=UPI002FCE0596
MDIQFGDDRLVFDGMRRGLYADLPADLCAVLDGQKTDPSNPEIARWVATLNDWTISPAPEQPLTTNEERGPRFFTVYPAGACNLACGYCYNDRGRFGGHGVMMSDETAEQSLAYLKDHFSKTNWPQVQVTLLGGEPTTNPKVVNFLAREVLALNTQPNMPVIDLVIDSNGVAWDQTELFEILRPHAKRVLVELSLDGLAERHDAQRPRTNGGGSHDHVVATAKRLQDLDISVRIVAVAPPPFEFVTIGEELLAQGFTDFRINQLEAYQFGTGEEIERGFRDWAQRYESYAKWTLRHKQAGLDFYSDLDQSRDKILRMLSAPVSPYACNAGRKLIGISAEGQIAPCDRFFDLDGYHLGSVADPNKTNSAHWLEQLADDGHPMDGDGDCSRCFARWKCRGGCYAKQVRRPGGLGDIERKDCPFIRHRFAVDLWYTAKVSLMAS